MSIRSTPSTICRSFYNWSTRYNKNFKSHKIVIESVFKIKTFKNLMEMIESFFNIKNFKSR